MKLIASSVVVCLFSVVIFIISPKIEPVVEAAKLSQGQCFNFDPNESIDCTHPSCEPNKTIMSTTGSYTGPGLYALELRFTICKVEFPACQDTGVYYYERVPWTPCCDLDNDGYQGSQCMGNDCNDNNSSIYPGANETCNFVDDNCNGQIDEGFDQDGDGYKTCQNDCNDGDGVVNPGADPCSYCGPTEDINW